MSSIVRYEPRRSDWVKCPHEVTCRLVGVTSEHTEVWQRSLHRSGPSERLNREPKLAVSLAW